MMLGMVLQGGKKMSKSAGHAGDPQKLLDRYGADGAGGHDVCSTPGTVLEWAKQG